MKTTRAAACPAAVLMLALTGTGCGSGPAGQPAGTVIAEAEAELDQLHSAVSLPQVVTDNTGPVPDAIRVTIAPSGIYVDVLAFLRSAPTAVVERFVDIVRTAHFEFGLVQRVRALSDFAMEPLRPPEGSAFIPEPLLEDLARRRVFALSGMAEPEGGFPISIHADRGAPFALVRHVLHIARHEVRRANRLSSFGTASLIVDAGGQPAALRPDPPVRPVSSLGRPEVCAGPLAYIREDGVFLLAQAYTLDGQPVLRPEEEVADLHLPRYPEWNRQLIIGSDGRCPSVPLAGGGHDLERLAKLARAIGSIAPGCASARVGADDGVAWNDVARVAGTLLNEAGFERVDFTEREARFRNGCEGARILP